MQRVAGSAGNHVALLLVQAREVRGFVRSTPTSTTNPPQIGVRREVGKPRHGLDNLADCPASSRRA